MVEQNLKHSLSQQQTLSPQMQQSLKVLQASVMELRQIIQSEIEENPVLEEESNELSLEEISQEEEEVSEEFSELSELTEEWREYHTQIREQSSDREEKNRFLFENLTREVGLQEHLLGQLHVLDISSTEKELGELLIGHIDEKGYLNVDTEELHQQRHIPLETLQHLRKLIQSFTPVGVGASNLSECLRIQLERLGLEDSIEMQIVENHLEALAKKQFTKIEKKLHISRDRVKKAADFIATLDPKPGLRFSQKTNHYITPDISVEKENQDFVITFNNHHLPTLKISNLYKDLISGGTTVETKKYIRDKIQSAKFLIKSIYQRQETLEKITQKIFLFQRDFLEEGPQHLSPMTMAQIAAETGVHETTVSRAIAGKYVSTPHGVYELKYFFSSGYTTASGEILSSKSVQNVLRQLIKTEDPKNPLSDQQLVEALKQRGISIARRTVAKYREELNILPSHLRKSLD